MIAPTYGNIATKYGGGLKGLSELGKLSQTSNLSSSLGSLSKGVGAASQGTSLLDDVGKYLGSESFANLGQGLGGIASIASAGAGIYGAIKSSKLQKEAIEQSKKEFNENVKRYNELEKERKANNAEIAASASAYKLPTERM